MTLTDITESEKIDILNRLKIIMRKFNKHKYQALPTSYNREKDNLKFEMTVIKREPELEETLIQLNIG